MKKNFIVFVISYLLMTISFTAKAQFSENPINCLGTHCYISVFLNSDPVTSDGMLKYTINVPREGISNLQGPAGNYFANNLGNTVDIYIRKIHLDLAADGVTCEIPFELYVNKWVDYLGNPISDNTGIQCFYWVKFMVSYD